MKLKSRPSVIFPRTVFGPRCTCFRIPTVSTDLLQRVCIAKQTCCGSERTPTLASIKEMDTWVFKVRPISVFFHNCFIYNKYRPKRLGLNCKDRLYISYISEPKICFHVAPVMIFIWNTLWSHHCVMTSYNNNNIRVDQRTSMNPMIYSSGYTV